MADFTWVPHTVHEIEREGPFTLVTRCEDGSKFIRQKSATIKRRWRLRFREGLTITKAILDFLETKGFGTTWTYLAYDPSDTTTSTEATVRTVPPLPTTSESHSGYYEFEFEIEEA